ncbi:MAG: NAD(P)H-hydrate dehydratase [Nannocystales bacterium]
MSTPASLWSAEQAAAADAYTMDTLGVPSPVLMERAALCVASEVCSRSEEGAGRPVVCLVGPGNNGADALAVARIAAARGLKAHAWLVSPHRNQAGEAQLALARAHGVQLHRSSESLPLEAAWVDGLLGTGSRGAPRGPLAEALIWVATRRGPSFAIDTPTGVDVDSGAVVGPAFRADVTVTLVRSKPGLHVTPGRDYAGSVVIADIGIAAGPTGSSLGALLTAGTVASALEALPKNAAHKGHRGHVAVVGGGPGTPGAAVLSGVAAMRAGAGLCTLVGSPVPDVRPELMRAEAEMPVVPSASVLVVGPGLTSTPPGLDLAALYREDPRPAVWDASALEAIDGTSTPRGPRVLTPHPKEAARMLGRWNPGQTWTSARVQENRVDAVRVLQHDDAVVAVLKGAGTVMCGGGALQVALEGSEALATAGSGDVLAGCIAGLLARGLAFRDAAGVGVSVHGRAGDLAAGRVEIPLALEIAESIPHAIRALSSGAPGPREPRFVRG